MKRFLALLALLPPLLIAGCSHPQPMAYYPPPPPAAFSAIASQGFQDGVAAAERDIRAGMPPNVERHPRFRNPPVPPAIEDYRHGFHHGYEQVFRQGPPPAEYR
jgi:hypothetical protein